jgi:23S rRNA pseudouridine955/2504/2580 synthase
MIELKIGDNEKDQRVDRFLLKLMRNDSRTNVYKYLRKKIIKVNGKKAKENYFLALGDTIQVFLPEAFFEEMIFLEKEKIIERLSLDIVHEDDDVLIVNKPVGLLTHPDKQEYSKTLSSYVNVYLSDLATRTFKPASIQRLDKNTSGLVIFAKNYDTLKRMNEMMRERQIKKLYLAVVEGKMSGKGEIKGFLEKDPEANKSRLYKHSTEKTKAVHTKYKVLYASEDYSLVELELLTGRSHQIRVSLQSVGHPIVGDVKYGGHGRRDVDRYLLNAYRVTFEERSYAKVSDEITEFIKKEMPHARLEEYYQQID